MITTIYSSKVAGKLLIQLLIWLFGMGMVSILAVGIVAVTFVDNMVIQDARWNSDQGIFCFTVLNNHPAFDKNPPVFSSKECVPSIDSATTLISATQSSMAQYFLEMIQGTSLYILASFKEFWVDTATEKQHCPALYLQNTGNNYVPKICRSTEVKNFDVHSEQQEGNHFVSLTTAKSRLSE